MYWILRLSGFENVSTLDRLVVWSLSKIIFSQNFKGNASPSSITWYYSENSDALPIFAFWKHLGASLYKNPDVSKCLSLFIHFNEYLTLWSLSVDLSALILRIFCVLFLWLFSLPCFSRIPVTWVLNFPDSQIDTLILKVFSLQLLLQLYYFVTLWLFGWIFYI